MCGLFGFLGEQNKYQPLRGFLENAIICGAVRGMDSTGIAGIQQTDKKEPSIFLYKRALSGPDFLQLTKTDKLLWFAELFDVCIGHNRAGTIGDITDDNAHPYHLGHIIGAHNGTLQGAGKLEDYSLKDRTDSWNIFNNMANLDELTTLKALNGAYVLTWVNLKEWTFNIARNDMRPLACVWETKKEQLYWASEAGMLRWLTLRNEIETEEKMWEPSENTWYKFPINNPKKYEKIPYEKWSYQSSYVIKPIKKGQKSTIRQALEDYDLDIGDKIIVRTSSFLPLEGRAGRGHIILEYNTQYSNKFKVCIWDQPFENFTKWKDSWVEVEIRGAKIESEEIKLTGKFVRLIPLSTTAAILNPPEFNIVGPGDTKITSAKWFELTAKGCIDCGEKLKLQDNAKIGWTHDGPMCEACCKTAWTLEGKL